MSELDAHTRAFAQNLGEEGTAYLVEALAFNNTCLALDLSNNGIGRLGTAALCQVLPTCGLQTLVLATNSVGDDGSELLAKTLSGEGGRRECGLGCAGQQGLCLGVVRSSTATHAARLARDGRTRLICTAHASAERRARQSRGPEACAGFGSLPWAY